MGVAPTAVFGIGLNRGIPMRVFVAGFGRNRHLVRSSSTNAVNPWPIAAVNVYDSTPAALPILTLRCHREF